MNIEEFVCSLLQVCYLTSAFHSLLTIILPGSWTSKRQLLLFLLDLTVAVDTVDQVILLHLLNTSLTFLVLRSADLCFTTNLEINQYQSMNVDANCLELWGWVP